MFKVTYNGEGVASNALGVFQNGTTAYTSNEKIAQEIAVDTAWSVTDKDGNSIGPKQVEEPVHAAAFDSEPSYGSKREKYRKHKSEDAKPQD